MASKLEHWRAVEGFDGLWETVVWARGGKWPLRAVALLLDGGEIVVQSPPTRVSDALWQELETLGRPTFALAPNHFHNLGVPKMLARYPEAKVVSSDVARPRLEKKLSCAIDGLEPLRERLRDGCELLELPGTRNGEVWLAVDGAAGARAWVVCDAFFNVSEHPAGLFGVMCRLTRTSRGLQIGRTWNLLALRDKRAYGAWVDLELDRAPPTTLVMSHGEILSAPDLGDTLRALCHAHV
ncbi:MAG: hypothetical protein KC503_22235 [Myxococcales bacterium]|nr:hypothetical protein [Myxococcales bacterium]